jgi:hypothetical protein
MPWKMPIDILTFLRTFKEAADHNDVGEGAAARFNPYFLKDAAKEGYRAHMDEAQSGMLQYPHMIQYLLETYALDDELLKAYLTVSTAKQLERGMNELLDAAYNARQYALGTSLISKISRPYTWKDSPLLSRPGCACTSNLN